MKSLRRNFACAALFSGLAFLSFGCGGDEGGPGQRIDEPPDMTAKPDMSKMPGYNEMQKKLQEKGQTP
jgi:hypothetical protein